ncbi:MAG: hypothetical protein GX639_11520 [Fibrobacter sp.]|nr:hypothetical protein [Fibrobacter sp.]
MHIFKLLLIIFVIIPFFILNLSCKDDDFTGDESGNVTWTTPHQVNSIGEVAFAPYFGAIYKFDDWRNRSTGNYPKISYVFVATDSITAFCVTIGAGLLGAYDSVVASIPPGFTNKLSFDTNGISNRVKLYAGHNPIKVYSLPAASNGDTIEIYVHAYYDLSDTICLAGDCPESEDRLQVVVCPVDTSQKPVPGITNYYDQNGRLTRSIKISDKSLVYDVMYSYDVKGNRLSSKTASLKY